MRRVLLFGGSGFLGGHVRRALAGDAELICPSRAQCDLTRGVEEIVTVLRASRPDAVVSCAGRIGGDAAELIEGNTLATAHLIEAVARAAPAARLVRIGSAAEYGPVPHGHAVTEEDPAAPTSEYGLSQLAATRLVELAAAAGRIDGVVLRVFNPVGPGLPPAMLLGRAAALLRDAGSDPRPITLGSSTVHRDFVDVRDVAAAVVAALRAPSLTERVFNVASGRAVTTREAVRLVAEAAGYRGELRDSDERAERSAAVDWMCGDVRRATRLLGWTPAYALEDSVKALWAHAAN